MREGAPTSPYESETNYNPTTPDSCWDDGPAWLKHSEKKNPGMQVRQTLLAPGALGRRMRISHNKNNSNNHCVRLTTGFLQQQ